MSTVLEQSVEITSPNAAAQAFEEQRPTVRLFTVEEYDRMIEAGILDQEERVELIEGRILKMSPKSIRHAALTDTAANYLSKRLGDRAVVRNQNPIRLANGTEPEPDLVLAVPREKAYFDHHPTAEEVLLVIEVADTSLSYDRREKSQLYAKAGIVQYLVLNARDSEIEDHRDPSPDGYRNKQTYRADQSFTLVAFPDISIKVGELLPPE